MHVLRDWLKSSGWSSAFVEAHITLEEGSHITRTRWTHQVTAASLNVQQRATYRQYLDIHLAGDVLCTFCGWCTTQSVPVRMYWSFVRYMRAINFQLYLEMLRKFASWLFPNTQVGCRTISHTCSSWSTHIQVFTISSHKVTSQYKQQDTYSHQRPWIKNTNSWMKSALPYFSCYK